MIRTRFRSAAATLGVTVAVGLISCPSAGAVTPPQLDPEAQPPSGSAGPLQPMRQQSACTATGVVPGTSPGVVSPNQMMLNVSGAWQHSRGEGQTVAVIGTGVQPGPRLPNVEPGGDYVESTDGLTDCDGRGTLVAGLIAGQPAGDGFSGVAPAARILAIRQTSMKFAPQTPGQDPNLARASLEVATLARAIVRAADLGARVINVSNVACIPANKQVNQAELGAALEYAAVQHDAVIVAAAGDTGSARSTGATCDSNPLSDASRPGDPRNWAGVTSVSVPSWWQQYVLSVGSLTSTGQPSEFTMAGPWLGIAAPGENITSVSNNPNGGLANGLPNEDQEMTPISGTGYAAAYVSGVAALVRSEYPEMSADEVVHRITATAHSGARSPSNIVGAGSIDPVAALTWDVPPADVEAGDRPAVKQVNPPPPPEEPDMTPRIVAFVGTGVLALAVIATAVIRAVRKDKTT